MRTSAMQCLTTGRLWNSEDYVERESVSGKYALFVLNPLVFQRLLTVGKGVVGVHGERYDVLLGMSMTVYVYVDM